jgi:hydroxymethylglutaryl-CoA lyase
MPTRRIEMVEVAARDGLQNEPGVVATAVKVELIERLEAAGIRRLEAASFVNPKRVPQMADAEAIMAALPPREDVTHIGLVLNKRGFERAQAAGCKEVNYALVATDTFSKRNQGTTTKEGTAVYRQIAEAAHAAGIRCSLTITVAFGCPFEGEVPAERVMELIERALGPETFEVGLADTIGCAVPSQVDRLFREVAKRTPGKRLRAHFHNTRNTGIANCYAAVEAGVDAIDASLGGIGGCPFAPAATGNVPTEDVVYMLSRMGIETGVDLAALIRTTGWLEGQIGRRTPALVSRAGLFPPVAMPAA